MPRNTFKLQFSCPILSDLVRFCPILSDFVQYCPILMLSVCKCQSYNDTDLTGYRKWQGRPQAIVMVEEEDFFPAVYWRENSKINNK